MPVPKIFNDPIHDTPQYQRLRDISQLGGVYYVFTGASSNRFEHCIGVSHLAKTFVEKIKYEQPELNISDADVLCIEIAGLCHDLGHGPFSHLYDGTFLPAFNDYPHFAHEHASIGILDVLIEENDLLPDFVANGLNSQDIHFIKELILGDPEEAPEGFEWKGRGQKSFLYDIVANKRNGIDVDKFDYFARDCHVLGLSKSFDCMRLMRFARVFSVTRSPDGAFLRSGADSPDLEDIGANRQLEICFHTKEAWNLFELFHTRYALHKRAYQHRVSAAVELMLTEVLILANPFVLLPGEGGRPCRMSDCPGDMHAYWKLTDYVVKLVENSSGPDMEAARCLLHRIRRRDLFSFVGEILLTPRQQHVAANRGALAKTEVLRILRRKRDGEYDGASSPCAPSIASEDVICQVVKMGYGKGGKNPVLELTAFFRPEKSCRPEINAATLSDTANDATSYCVGTLPAESVSRLIPNEFEETYLRVYTRLACQRSEVGAAFLEWCDMMKLDNELASNLPLESEVK